MFDFITKWFKKKPSAMQRMKSETMKAQTITVANKQPFYHEMIGQLDGTRIVRIYNRNSGVVVEEVTKPNKEEAIETSLVFLNKYNKGVQE